jgi:U3 small nucleolar RNA-associated protein 21
MSQIPNTAFIPMIIYKHLCCAGFPVLLSGSPAGHIALWNLEERKLAAQMRDAHCRAVSGMRALPGEALLVTSSPDNTLKMWVFDMADGGGRLLRYREGHY